MSAATDRAKLHLARVVTAQQAVADVRASLMRGEIRCASGTSKSVRVAKLKAGLEVLEALSFELGVDVEHLERRDREVAP